MAFLPILTIYDQLYSLGTQFWATQSLKVSESVIFELNRVENGGLGPKMNILVLIVPYILMYGILPIFAIFSNFIALGPNFGHLITLGV
jgi:hypothetical protein